MSDLGNTAALPATTARSGDERVRVPKAAELVASHIRRRIIDGVLGRGENLPTERDLAAAFLVSRPVVREALRVLESEHFIRLVRGARRGAVINDPTPSLVTRAAGIALRMKEATLGDIYDARAQIESSAARFAATRRPVEASSALLSHVAYEVKVVDDDRVVLLRAIAEFHRVLLEECGQVTLLVIGEALRRVTETHLAWVHQPSPTSEQECRKRACLAVQSHKQLADLIALRDGAGAQAHWLLHLNNTAKHSLPGLMPQSVVEIPD